MIGQMAIAIALFAFNDLGRSVTPTFLSETDFIHNYLHIVQKRTKNQCGKLKNFKVSVHATWNRAILRLQGAWNYGR